MPILALAEWGSRVDRVTPGWYSCTMRWELEFAGERDPREFGELDPEQRSAVEHRGGPLLITGGAGSGKTFTLAAIVADRIAGGVDPSQIAVLTFGKESVRRFRDDLLDRLSTTALPSVGTVHSLAFNIVMASGDAVPRLLSGAEEDARIREVISGVRAQSGARWPDHLAQAATTSSFAKEVRVVIARLKELGLTGSELVDIGEREGRPEWIVAGHIATNEADVMALENSVDYTELVQQAIVRAPHSPVASAIKYLYVDECQELGGLQRLLVNQIAHRAIEFTVAGNPDETLFAFRGASSTLISDFALVYPGANQITLTRAWRFGESIARATRSTYPDGPLFPFESFRNETMQSQGSVQVEKYGGRTARAAFLAETIRRLHIENGVAWNDMAILGRAVSDLPAITQGLTRAGVPVVVATDDIALRDEPAVAHLLGVITIALSPQAPRPQSVLDLLTGPLVGLDPSEIRRLGRALRERDRGQSSEVLIADLIVHGDSTDIPPALIGDCHKQSDLFPRISRIQRLLRAIRESVSSGDAVAETLWIAWTGGEKNSTGESGWPAALRERALGHSGSAHHDLDAIMALFATAERFGSRSSSGMVNFMESLRSHTLPAEPVASRGLRADAVQVMTVHQSKGREWQRVWLTGLEEGVWPNLSARGSVLRAEEIGPTGSIVGTSSVGLMREEQNLLYVALTRARESVTLTCIDEGSEGGDQPSRFVRDLVQSGVSETTFTGFPRSRSSWSGLAATLRSVLADPQESAEIKRAAGEILAEMGPGVGPDSWWGIAPITESQRPVRPLNQPLKLSGSGLDSVLACPLKWFLDSEVHAQVSRGPATAFGSVVHAVAEFVAKGDVAPEPAAMQELISGAWRNLIFEAPWQSQRELTEAALAANRFLRYHQREERVFLKAEGYRESFIDVPTPSGGTERMHISGYIDRIESDPDGRLIAIDLKNMKHPPTKSEIVEHGQLGIYQLLLRDEQPQIEPSEDLAEKPIGAALVQLRAPDRNDMPKVQAQVALESSVAQAGSVSWIEQNLGIAAEIIRTEAFIPIPGNQCTFCAYHSTCPAQSTDIFRRTLEDKANADD